MNFDVCIIGAGASGSLLSILLAKQNKKICLIDRFDAPAKKILVTGNGKCNITNQNLRSEFYNQNIDDFISRFGYNEAKKQLEELGILIYADEMGRCYPISNSAKTVQFVLNHHIQKLGVQFVSAEVFDVEQMKNGFKITCSEQNNIQCKNVVFACGVNEFSISMLKKFGIGINEIMPSLVALKTKQSTKRLEGQRLSNVKVTAKIGDKLKTEFGEVLFKNSGLSGISIFNISAFFAKNKAFQGKISINLLPKWQKSEIYDKIFANMNIFQNVHDCLRSLFSKELASEILKRADIQDFTSLSKIQTQKIIDIICSFDFDVVGAYSNNQVLSGGVKLDELTNDLQNKKNHNMYFCGELCDVDGICGGYNLQWAWTSANIVAEGICKNFQI